MNAPAALGHIAAVCGHPVSDPNVKWCGNSCYLFDNQGDGDDDLPDEEGDE